MIYDGAGTIIYYDEPMTPTSFEYWMEDNQFEAICVFEDKPFDLHIRFHPGDFMVEFLCEEMQEGRGVWDIHEFHSLGIITIFKEIRKDKEIVDY